MKLPDKNLLMVHYGALGFSWLTFYLLRSNGLAYAISSAIAVGAGLEIGVFALLRSAEKRLRLLEQEFEAFNALPMSDVRERVSGMLVPRSRDSSDQIGIPDGLTASQTEFFDQFDGARLGDGTELSIKDFRPSQWLPGFVVIGGDGTSEIVTKLGDETIWEIDGPVEENELDRMSFPSIWHFYLSNSGRDWKVQS